MNCSKGIGVLLALAFLDGCTGSHAATLHAGSTVGRDPLWDDGRAEFSSYTGTTERDGELRPTEARIIVVKEDLLRTTLVKSDSGPVPGRTLEALKLNFIADFPTGTYSYHQMASVFFERTSLEVLKENMSHTEGCGITFVHVAPEHGLWVHEAHSYWEGEADRRVAIVWPAGAEPHLWWDALPVSLRAWIGADRSPSERAAWLLPSQIGGRTPIENTKPVRASIRVSDGGMLDVPAGRFPTRKFAVTTARGTDLFWFDEQAPHVLLMMETAARRKLALRKTQRLDYWNHRAAGDERLVQ
jgi:hypothetical protein